MTTEELQALIEQCGVHPVLGLEAGGYWIEQNAWELARFLTAMQELGVQSVLEIGTGAHAGLSRFLHEHMHWHVTTVDKNGHWGDFPGIEFVITDTRRDFGDRRFDLLIIDGNHTYEFVKGDHEWYGKYATKAIMFHDICGLRDCEDVKRYWDEIYWERVDLPETDDLPAVDWEGKANYHEIIADGEQRVGIGWIDLTFRPVTSTTPSERPLKVLEFDPFVEYGGIREGYVPSIADEKPKRVPARKPRGAKKAAK